MAYRFPLQDAPDTDAKVTMAELLSEVYDGPSPFPVLEEDGKSMIGPYAALSYTPEMARAILTMWKTCVKPSHIKPRNRELATLALCSVYDAPYVAYCHRIAGEMVGLTSGQIDDALNGKEPQGLKDEELAAYRLGRALSETRGPLEDALFNSIASKMEKSQAVGVANIVGGYLWIVTLIQLNGEDRRWASNEHAWNRP
ncbi:AhpD-like protein [Hypomontagnella submonticulosa]|nr:AhpD-like protein [Hypomontagnella submonticulosa]